MPFSNANNDEDSGYLVDGIVEDLITEFSMIRELELVSRQSCFDFRGSDMELKEFCEKFDVDYVVSGNIRSSGKRVRISVELSDAKTEHQIWNNKFDKILEDIFDVQDEIAHGGNLSPLADDAVVCRDGALHEGRHQGDGQDERKDEPAADPEDHDGVREAE